MSILLEDLINKLPSDSAERVSKTKDRLNRKIRDALRHETGLKLSRGISESDDTAGISVPIKILPGVPAQLEGFAIPDEHRLAVMLAPYRNSLRQLRDSTREIGQGLVPILQLNPRSHRLLQGREANLLPSSKLADDLLKEADKYDLAKEILAVEEDVLGRYIFSQDGYDPDRRIELFWGIIGLVALQIGVTFEDLAVVVLAHELAHAYTHVGFDIDGEQWKLAGFSASDRALKEGLAQHYTMLVCKRIASQAPDALAAYRALLERQPELYKVQVPWEESFSPEQVRFSMLRMRRGQGKGKFAAFEDALKASKDQLRREERSQAAAQGTLI
jgi:hypothetical protein